MPLGIVIPTDRDEPIYTREFNGLSDYQEVIGGLIEPIDLPQPYPATMYVDEEGRLKNLELNARASLIVMAHNPLYLFRGINVLGPAVIVGEPDEEGETQDVPPDLVQLLTLDSEYKVLFQTSDDPEAWNGNLRRFTDVAEAYEHGINLAYRWHAVERIRVVAA